MKKRTSEEMKKWRCADCGKDTFLAKKDYYMVTTKIWNKFGLGGSREIPDGGWTHTKPSGMLCIGCLEDRMGRKLRLLDLRDCPVNHFNWYTAKLIKIL